MSPEITQAIFAIIAAPGLVGLIAVESISILQQSSARGCPASRVGLKV
jgi:hypothetical protein